MQNLKNRFIRIVLGWIIIVLVWFSVFFIINLIPSRLAVINKGNVETTFKRLAEVRDYYNSSFIPSRSNLNRIDVLFKNPNLESRDELEILVKEDNYVVYKQKFTGFNFGDTSHARLDFEPIVEYSINRRVTVEIRPTKIVDGKLYFGVRDNEIDLIQYYGSKFDTKNSFIKSVGLMKSWVILLPLLLITLLLW